MLGIVVLVSPITSIFFVFVFDVDVDEVLDDEGAFFVVVRVMRV